MIYFITGPIGAGKSTYSRKLAAETNGIIFSIDDWMVKLYGSDMPLPIDLNWVLPRVERCEELIWATAVSVVQAGVSVILDLGLMKARQRQRFINLGDELGLDSALHYVSAETALRLERVLQRNREKCATFSFEVNPLMFHFMDSEFEIPSVTETENFVFVATD